MVFHRMDGLIESYLATDWLFHYFLEFAPSVRPFVLLLDGHTSHYNPEVIKLGAAEGLIMIALPPITTHLLQPLIKVFSAP